MASTPVIAFKTGGLKDTVNEFDIKTLKGNGIHFEDYKVHDLISAIKRAFDIFNDKEKYQILRDNSL